MGIRITGSISPTHIYIYIYIWICPSLKLVTTILLHICMVNITVYTILLFFLESANIKIYGGPFMPHEKGNKIYFQIWFVENNILKGVLFP